MTLYLMNSLKHVSINSYLNFISSLKKVNLAVKVDILEEDNELPNYLIRRMIRNGENRCLLTKGKQPKTDSGELLQEICDK